MLRDFILIDTRSERRPLKTTTLNKNRPSGYAPLHRPISRMQHVPTTLYESSFVFTKIAAVSTEKGIQNFILCIDRIACHKRISSCSDRILHASLRGCLNRNRTNNQMNFLKEIRMNIYHSVSISCS